MYNIELTRNTSPIVSEMVLFVNDFAGKPEFVSKTEGFVHDKVKHLRNTRKEQETINLLVRFDENDLSLYLMRHQSKEDLLRQLMFLSYVKGSLLKGLSSTVEESDIWKIERQVSPSLEAYKYKGNNKTDIGYSNISYGLLFE